MARTDRDMARFERRNHYGNECPNRYREWRLRDGTEAPCLWCKNEPYVKWRWYGIRGKAEWNKACRREERVRAKTAIRQCRDWDALSIKYRRPYWD